MASIISFSLNQIILIFLIINRENLTEHVTGYSLFVPLDKFYLPCF